MTQRTDWLPSARDGQLSMAKAWTAAITQNQTRWNIPPQVLGDLAPAIIAATTALEKARNEATRTPVATAACKAAFDALAKIMRDIKDRYAKIPPMLSEDLIALGLHPRDTTKTPVPPPTAQPAGNISFPGLHLVEITHIGPAAAPSADARSDYGVRMYYGFTGAATRNREFRLSAPPTLGSQLPYSAFTRRSKHRFDFEGESGNTLYMCMRYENEKGETGPFGPMMQFSVP